MRRSAVLAVVVAGALAGAVSPMLGEGAETVTMTIRPTVLRYGENATATGTVASGRAQQDVTIETRACDATTWHELIATKTQDGGGWLVDFQPGIGGLVRAVSGGASTEPAKVQQRPWVHIEQRPAKSFSVGVLAERPLWHRKLRVERFDRTRQAWRLVKTVLLAETQAEPGDPLIWSHTDHLKLAVAKEMTLRAVLPLAEAKPCYLAGYSVVIRA